MTKNSDEIIRLPPHHCHYNPIEHVWDYKNIGKCIDGFKTDAIFNCEKKV